MTHKQYSDLQRYIGYLEGIGEVIPDCSKAAYYDTIEVLSNTIDEIKQEADNAKESV